MIVCLADGCPPQPLSQKTDQQLFQLLASLRCKSFWDNILKATERPHLVGEISSLCLDATQYLDHFGHWLSYAQRTSSRKCKACRRAAVIYKRLRCCIIIVQHKATKGVS